MTKPKFLPFAFAQQYCATISSLTDAYPIVLAKPLPVILASAIRIDVSIVVKYAF